MRVLMLYPEFPDTFWSFKHALKFVSKKASNPPLGLITVASILPLDWEKRLIDLNVQNLNNKDLEWADYVFISAMNIQSESVAEIIEWVNNKKPIVAGGPLFTACYENYPQIDHFILNEGEITLPLFLSDVLNRTTKRIYSTTDFADMSKTPIPSWELIDFRAYDSMAIQFSRGCPFNCDFCNVTALLGHKPRTKTSSQLISELDALYQHGWRRNIFIVDDNFIGNKKILKESLLPALIEWRKGKKGCLFTTEASINLADDSELLEMMVMAGFRSVFIGIETPEESSLSLCNKKQNQNRDLVKSVRTIQTAGIQVLGGFIVGFDTDSPSAFQRQIDFIQKSGIVTAMVGLLQAPFGTDLYRRMKREGRLSSEMSGDNLDGSTNIIPIMPIQKLMAGYQHILKTIFSPAAFYRRIQTFLEVYEPVYHPVSLSAQEIAAFFKSILLLGVLGKERKYYWQLFFWALTKKPALFPVAITLSIYGYHFMRVSDKVLNS